ncbi:hypothetical protein HDE68_003489 [Pedobacter cryoconitis]|uniref:Uncharacterized protein n=1 Tax=Pedobacter cryoconitis TaxID=188932 RepID=A0A7W8ZP19_9SPHI|nr:hypothetical protein [Pedobacter cryoconitis]MBB5637574.1 hypothetical protein [Pedobacter cryoconitis]
MKKTKAMTFANLVLSAIKKKIQNTEVLPGIGMNPANQENINGNGELTGFESKNYGKKLLALFLLVIATLTASAQKPAVVDAFSKHGIDVGILNGDNLRQPDDFAFDFKQTTVTTGKQSVTVARFDPSGPKEEQWTVISVDGKSPSKSDINSFRKNHSKQPASNQADESSYKIEKETSDYLVISYKADPGSVDKDAAFMKDCRLYMTVNLRTKKLEKVQALNEKPIKIKILNAEKLDLVIKYSWNEQAKRYFSVNEDLNISAKFMGQAIPIQTTTEYSSYTKK